MIAAIEHDARGDGGGRDFFLAYGGLTFLAGAWFTGHSLWSLIGPTPGAATGQSMRVSLVTSGTSIGLAGVF